MKYEARIRARDYDNSQRDDWWEWVDIFAEDVERAVAKAKAEARRMESGAYFYGKNICYDLNMVRDYALHVVWENKKIQLEDGVGEWCVG